MVRAAAAAIIVASILPAAAVGTRSASSPVTDASEPASFDVDGDGNYEILLAGTDGKLAQINGKSLAANWVKKLSDKPLTPPAVGEAQSIPAVAVAGTEGKIWLVRAGDGELLGEASVGGTVIVAPTVATRNDGNDTWVVVRDDGAIVGFTYGDNQLKQTFNVSNEVPGSPHGVAGIGRITRSATAADLDGDGTPEIIVGSASGIVQVFPIDRPQARTVARTAQGTSIAGNCAVGRFTNSGPLIAIGTSTGRALIYRYVSDPAGAGRLEEVTGANVNGQPQGHLLTTIHDDPKFPLLVVSTEYQIGAYDGAAHFMSVGKRPFATTNPPLSILAQAGVAGKPTFFVSDAKDQAFVVPSTMEGEPPPIKGITEWRGVGVVGNFDGSGKVQVAHIAKESKQIRVVTFDESLDPAVGATLTWGGTYQRDGSQTADYVQYLAAFQARAKARASALAADATAKLQSGDKEAAMKLAAAALAIRPTQPEARGIVSRALWKKVAIGGAIAAVIAVPLLWFGGIFGFRKLRRRVALDQARLSLNRGDTTGALTALSQTQAPEIAESSVALTYAEIFVRMPDPPVEAIPVLQDSFRKHPSETKWVAALARAYAHAGMETPEALEIYQVVLSQEGTERGKIAFHAAKTLLRSQSSPDQVVRLLRIAISEGGPAAEATDLLADFLIERKGYSEKYLGILEDAARRAPQSRSRWEGLAAAYLALKRLDDAPRRAAQYLVEFVPDSTIGYKLLAKCLFGAGEYERSLSAARRIMEGEPDDPDTVLMVGQCMVGLQRRDTEAILAYRRALEVAADDPGILGALAKALLSGKIAADDEEAYKLLRRAAKKNQDDTELWGGLADVAHARGDFVTVAACLERLAALGRGGPQLMKSLAEAYLAANVLSPQAERACREALKAEPDNPQILSGLARIMTVQGRTDGEALATLARAMDRGTDDVDVGKHLVRTLMIHHRNAEALEVVKTLRAAHPTDPDLERLLGAASVSSDRMDEGIALLERLAQERPDDTAALITLAEGYVQIRATHERARDILLKAAELAPERGDLHLGLARCHIESADFPMAVREYKKSSTDPQLQNTVREEALALVVRYPDRPELRWFLTNLLIDQNRLTEAVAQLQAIFETDPAQHKLLLTAVERILAKDADSVSGNLLKGMLLKTVSNWDGARACLEKAYRRNPTNPETSQALADLYDSMLSVQDDPVVRIELGRLQMATDNLEGAITTLQRAAQDYRHEQEAGRLLGICYISKGMLEFALQQFRNQPVDDELKGLLFDLAQRYEQKGDVAGAKQAYKLVFQTDPAFRNVRERLEALAGNTADPMALDRTEMVMQLPPQAQRRYELLEELGRGAMGIVYKARDNELDEIVALKILPDNLNNNPQAVSRFKTEARSARRLSHPNIVRIHDIGEDMGRKYISMEFIDGTDLKGVLRGRKTKLTYHEVAALIHPIACALDYAHASHIVHRDIKPANIMINREGVVKVSDFGIAKMLENTGETMVGAIIGTPLYMSPEQVQGQPVDNRSDIYALGIMTYELLRGRPPFVEGDLGYQHVHVQPPEIPGIPADLKNLVWKCLAKDRNDRWPTAGAFARALEQSGYLQALGYGATITPE